MTNSSPQPPLPPRPNGEPQRKKKSVIDLDEAIAILVAFATIGAILFWSLARGKGGFSPRSWLSALNTTEQADLNAANLNANVKASRVLSAKTAADTAELSSKYLGQTPELEIAETENAVVIPGEIISARTTERSFNPANIIGTAAPVATGLVLTTPEKAETTPPKAVEKPPEEAETTPPKAVEKPPEKTETAPEIAFQDVPTTYWAYPFVDKLGKEKLLLPSDTNQFEPDKLVTRAGMASLISQAFDLPETEAIKNFGDVSNKNAIAADVDKAVKKGFMKGYSDEEFRPIDNIPRYQVLVTLATGLGLTPSQDADTILSEFDDGTNMPDWAKEQVAAASEAGLIVNPPGVSSNSLKPETKATRAEAAAMIHQALVKLNKLKPIESEYILNP